MSVLLSWTTGSPRSGISAYLTPAKKKRKLKYGKLTNQSRQGCCAICKNPPSVSMITAKKY